MRIGRRAFLLSASTALHLAAVGAMLVIVGGPGPVLFVDLASVDLMAGPESASTDASPPAAAIAASAPAHASRPVRTLARSASSPAVATPPARPAPAEPTEASPPPAPSAPPTFEVSREPAPFDGAPPAVSHQPVTPLTGTVDTPAAVSRGAASSDTMGEGGKLGGATSGALLALALPGDGRGGGVPAEYGPYLARFRQRIQEALVYPLAARRQGLSGTIELEVLVEPSGQIRSVRLVSSSSHPVLDDAAADTVKELAPLPLPENLPRRPLRIRLPVVFRLR